MTKIHAIYNTFEEPEELVKASLNQLIGIVDSIAISCVSHSNGLLIDEDNDKVIDEFIKENRYNTKIYYRSPHYLNNGYKRNQGIIKTELMNLCNPEDGDWIWIVEADELYEPDILNKLKSRYILEHQILDKQDIRWIVVPQLEFCHRDYFYYSWSGRFFKYRKGANFDICNKFRWGNEMIYDDKYRWDVPIQYCRCFHLKFVKPLDRLIQRYSFSNNNTTVPLLNWFHIKYMPWYNNPTTETSIFPSTVYKYTGKLPYNI